MSLDREDENILIKERSKNTELLIVLEAEKGARAGTPESTGFGSPTVCALPGHLSWLS